jgi:hypothetical protein
LFKTKVILQSKNSYFSLKNAHPSISMKTHFAVSC